MSVLGGASAGAPWQGGPAWLASQVQVRVGEARGLRLKGGRGDAFAELQLGRQRVRTAVATGGRPRWDEECALPLPPDADPDAAAAASPGRPTPLLLTLTVWQRALVGPDRFLGRALLPLGPLLQAGRAHPDQWLKLHSKAGKKEKERGEIQVGIHFTRSSLTASMFDLSIKDKPRSPFRKLRDKMKGRQQYDLESASAIVPSSSGAALDEDLSPGGRQAKGGLGGFLFKNKLRRSSLTQSTTSLGSDSTVSSASSVAGVAASEGGAAPSPSRHGSLSIGRAVRDFLPSPKLTHKRAFSDEVSQINALPESRSVQNLKSQNEPVFRSSLCINGSHVYFEEASPRPAPSLSSTVAPPSRPQKPVESFSAGSSTLECEPPPWSSGSSFPRGSQKDPPRFIPSPPILAAQEEDKLSVKTLALSKQRNRAKMDEAAHAEGRPVQIAKPMVFAAEAGRGRALEEAQREEKPARSGSFCWGSTKENAGKSSGAEKAAAAAAAGLEGEKSSSWFSMKDAQDPSQRPSSQSGLLATTEATRDTCVWEDRGPSAFLRAGTLQPESAPPSVSAFEPAAAAAAAGTPLEWGDPFDAFATSRLRPEAQREPLPRRDPALEGLTGQDPPEDTSPPQISAGLPLRWPREAEGSPGMALEETLAAGGSLGKEPWGTGLESSPGHPPLQGAGGPLGACEEDARLNWEKAEAADSRGGAQQASPVGAPATVSGSVPPLSLALDSSASPLGSLERRPLQAPTKSRRERPAVLLLGTAQTSEPETGEDASAGTLCWDPARQEQAALQTPPEEAKQLGGGSAEEGRGLPLESWEQRGTGRQAAEAAPAKPPRTFSSLSLEEEANRALGGTQARRESQEGPGGAADGQGPPANDGSAPGVIGAGGRSAGRGTERLLLPAADDSPARANELMRQAGSLGDSVLAANEGAGGAKQLETCPGKPGLAGGGGEPCAGLSSDTRPEEGGTGPFGARPEPSPSVLFWTALEEQLLQSWAGASPEQPRGLGEGTLDLRPGLEQEGRTALTSPEAGPAASRSSQAPPALSASPRVLVSGVLRQGPKGSSSASDSELSSSWSDDRVVDFKKANFWQADRGEEEEEGSPSGNPFVSRVSPQKNPFVETGQVSPAAGPGLRDRHSEAAPQGLLPAPLLCNQPAAPFPHDHQPLAFSTPSPEEEEEAAVGSREFDFPSPIVPPATGEGSAASSLLAAHLSLALPSPSTDAAASLVSPTETRTAEEVPAQRTTSPHPVKPISASRLAEKQRRASLPLGQEKLKPKPPSGNDSGTPILPLEKTDLKRDPSLPDCSAKYYHLTHDELIQLLLKREAELSKSHEHIRELENYIDRLLVRIMEQSPTLLQVSLAGGAKAAK